MSLQLYDTYTRSTHDFDALRPPHVGLHTCGPTVYNYAHLGNLRTYIFEDILRRVLVFNGYQVNHVMNITDVGHLVSDGDTGEDKMETGAARTGKSVWEIAELYMQAFQADLRALNILEPDIWGKATDHIPEQIAFIQCICIHTLMPKRQHFASCPSHPPQSAWHYGAFSRRAIPVTARR